MSQQFKVGDPVTWESQSGESRTNKSGVVIGVVPEMESPWSVVVMDPYIDMIGSRNYRHHESYLVRVDPQPPKQGKSKIYWPLVGLLRKTNPA